MVPLLLRLGLSLQEPPLPAQLPGDGAGQGLDVVSEEGVVAFLLPGLRQGEKLVPAVLLELSMIKIFSAMKTNLELLWKSQVFPVELDLFLSGESLPR